MIRHWKKTYIDYYSPNQLLQKLNIYHEKTHSRNRWTTFTVENAKDYKHGEKDLVRKLLSYCSTALFSYTFINYYGLYSLW